MDAALRHRYLCAILSAVSLSVQWMNVIMATTEPRSMVSWNDAEVTAFLDYLLANKSRMGESGVFPQAVYNSAAIEIAKHHTSGPPKTGKACKSKWTVVCITLLSSILLMYQFSVKRHIQCNPDISQWVRLSLGQ